MSDSGSARIEPVPTETEHGRTPAVDRPATTPPPAALPSGERSPNEIERDIQATRERLALTIDEISDRVKPANVVQAGREKVEAELRNPDGSLRMERVGAAAAVVVAYVALKVAKAVRRRRASRAANVKVKLR